MLLKTKKKANDQKETTTIFLINAIRSFKVRCQIFYESFKFRLFDDLNNTEKQKKKK